MAAVEVARVCSLHGFELREHKPTPSQPWEMECPQGHGVGEEDGQFEVMQVGDAWKKRCPSHACQLTVAATVAGDVRECQYRHLVVLRDPRRSSTSTPAPGPKVGDVLPLAPPPFERPTPAWIAELREKESRPPSTRAALAKVSEEIAAERTAKKKEETMAKDPSEIPGTCGTVSKYKNGCRCDRCGAAKRAAYVAWRDRRAGKDSPKRGRPRKNLIEDPTAAAGKALTTTVTRAVTRTVAKVPARIDVDTKRLSTADLEKLLLRLRAAVEDAESEMIFRISTLLPGHVVYKAGAAIDVEAVPARTRGR